MVEMQVFRISTPASAVFRAKRWFYARFYVPNKQMGKDEIAEKNKEKWVELASKIIEKTRNMDRDQALRLIIYFDTKVVGYSKNKKGEIIKLEEFIPVGVKLEMFKKIGEEVIELIEGAKIIIESTTPSEEQVAL